MFNAQISNDRRLQRIGIVSFDTSNERNSPSLLWPASFELATFKSPRLREKNVSILVPQIENQIKFTELEPRVD